MKYKNKKTDIVYEVKDKRTEDILKNTGKWEIVKPKKKKESKE